MKKKFIGLQLFIVSAMMFVSSMVALYYNIKYGEDDFKSLLIPSLITLFIGFVLYMLGRKSTKKLHREDNYFIVAFTWVMFSILGMLPYLLSGTVDNVSDAFFETMSGFTTTGASVLNNINDLPHGILLWRCLTQWLGGLGVVVLTVALFSQRNKTSETQLFSAESPGMEVDKLGSRIRNTAQKLWVIYIVFTLLCIFAYRLGPMNTYDAICHALTTIATGGFSTHQESFAYWNSPYLEYVCSLFMFLSSVNFALFYFLIIGRWRKFFGNEEMRWFVITVLVSVFVFILLFYYTEFITVTSVSQLASMPKGFEEVFRTSLFHVLTIISSSGFQSGLSDYISWGPAFYIPTIIIMISGGCAGATCGGLKISRVMICLKNLANDLKRQLHPQAVFPVRVSGRVIPDQMVMRVLAFMVMYVVILLIGTALLSFSGLDFESAFGASVSAFSNTGPALGIFGPTSNYSAIPSLGKWVISAIMLIGRLEIFTVLILFTKGFKLTR